MLASFLVRKRKQVLKGVFTGRVVQDFDELGCNRVKVKLFGLTDKLDVEKLPYYRVQTSITDNPNTNINIPPVNSKVQVELDGDIYNGVIINSLTHIAPQ